jgi:hypothetical protein
MSLPPESEQQNLGVRVWCEKYSRFLDSIPAKFLSKVVAQLKGEILMLMLETSDCFRATFGVLRSLDESEGVSFHTFSLPEDLCMCLFLKNESKLISEAEIPEELEALLINMQGLMNLRSNQRDQDSEKHHLLKPLFIVSVI